MFSLQGKVALVTGAGSGIGAAIAECFADAGAHVYVADNNEANGLNTLSKIEKQGGKARLAVVDVTRETECQALAKRVLTENSGRCDILVNNAGVGHVGTILSTEPADLDRLWKVNLLGAYFLSRAILPAMVEHRAGSIINLGSVAAVMGMESRFAYTVTKHAVLGMTRAMALDHGAAGVRINCICPGRTQTPFVEARLREYADPREYMQQMVAPHALKRLAQPSEIAAAVLFLASDESAFVTGAAFSVDGGYTAGK
ncbi:MAG TPA: SDR family oxidoreductase [Verrucomicrobiae bacterium]|jgi:NAD(P)-dependent dehydrogenase (short-subunit alcohol dehydrogenase family)|nr:SDR family oxidoreductase [Verrucomicrobiae bacterium]